MVYDQHAGPLPPRGACREGRAGFPTLPWCRSGVGFFAGALTVSAALALMTHIIYLNNETAANQKNVQDAFEVMASVGTDPDSSSSSSWQDSSN